ncbi:MAG TPA: hypothetical protein VM889_07505 [Candidatus Thermoplasmatota archaeon]|nr:hypothetical protein [Candidatus Thermoplasmatota archaeon]
MAYTFGSWSLYTREVKLRTSGVTQRIFYFAKNKPASGMPTDLPAGYTVDVSTRTGMPYLRKA